MWTIRSALFLVLAAVILVDCFPQRDTESVEDEREGVPVPSIPAIAVPASPGFGYFPSFYGFFPDFDLITRIKALVSRLKTQIGDSFSDFDWSKGNTTSTTKVIDGHVVTVNETSIKDDDTDLVLHVKVIDVRPTEGAEESSEDSSETAETTTRKTNNNAGERAPLPTNSEEHLGNEIPKQPEEGVAESLDYNSEETREHLVETRGYLPSAYSIENVDPINEVDNYVEVFHPHEPISLQNDILINKFMSDQTMSSGMVQIPADVEVLSPDNRDIYATDVEEFVPNKYSYESLPYESLQFRPWSEKLTSLT